MYITAQYLYDRLIENKITEHSGRTLLQFMNVELTLNDRSAIGDLLQAWLGEWMIHQGIEFRIQENTQAFPDFLLDAKSDIEGLLEVKTFDHSRGATFDVANFDAYRRSLLTQAYRLDADYLIFGYTLNDGVLRIPSVWLKKIWEICVPSERYPLKCQVKQDVIVNIRPGTWYSTQTRYKPFDTRLDFVLALYETIKQYDEETDADAWLNAVKTNYAEHTGQTL